VKLLHVASSYPLTVGDSTAPFMEEMLSALAEEGHQVRVIVPRVSGLEEGPRCGVEVAGFTHAPARFQLWGYGRSLAGAGALKPAALLIAPAAMVAMAVVVRRAIAQWKPDIVHLHWLIPQGVLGLVLPRSVPIVISVHGADARFALGRLKPLARRGLQRADAVIAASAPILDAIASIDPTVRPKLRAIPHGADDRFGDITRSEARERLGLDIDRRVVFAVGRLVEKKGFDVLIGASGDPALSGTAVYIGGSGPEETALRDHAHGTTVSLLGQLDRNEVALWLAAADVVAIPSRQVGNDVDSGPVVLMEALASGTAVVSTPLGMAPAAIQQGVNGGLVAPDNVDALARELSAVLERSHEFGENARRTFLEIGSWRRVASQMGALYSEVATSTRSGGL
jgi:colanic acid/amylovoran biosynthesis glycosyltransferase